MTHLSTITADAVVEAATQIIKRSGSAARAAAWHAFVKFTDPQEVKLAAVHVKLFDQQEKVVISNMNKRPLKAMRDDIAKGAAFKRGPHQSALSFGKYLRTGIIDIKGEFDSRIDTWLFGASTWNKIFADETRDTISGIVILNGGRAMDDVIGVASAFDVTDPNVRRFVKATPAEWGSLVNETTGKDLRRTLTAGMEAGESMSKLKKRVADYYDLNAKDVRAPLIARTETTGAANFGTQEAYKQSGVVEEKEWVAVLDSRVRDSHSSLDGTVIPLDDTFSNGLEYPGDPNGDVAELANCRCTLVPVIKEVTE